MLIQDSPSDFRILFDSPPVSGRPPLFRVNQDLVPVTASSLVEENMPLPTQGPSVIPTLNLLDSNLILQEHGFPGRWVMHFSTYPRQVPWAAERSFFFRP